MALIASVNYEERIDFSYLKKSLGLTDGNLGAHLTKLESEGYLHLEKIFVNKKPKTYVSITDKGLEAFDEHIAALKEIINGK
ncbi:MAG: transcriptional regulator [Planctomycetes bacterium]|nr:transcriptional regulator [Planctomycetota bacterium]